MVEALKVEIHYNDEIDEILIWVMVVTDEILEMLTVVELALVVEVETEVAVYSETEVTDDAEHYELGVETDIIDDQIDDNQVIVYIELEEEDEIEQLVLDHHILLIEVDEETDEIEVMVLTEEIQILVYLVPTDETDEMLGEECTDYEYLYEVTELTIVLMHIEVMVEMVDVLMILVYQDEYDEMQQMVEQYISFIEEHLQNDVLMFLEVKVDVDEVMEA